MKPRFIALSDAPEKSTRWLLRGLIPLGAVTVCESDPEGGKSTMVLDLVARVTTGAPSPLTSDSCPQGGALLFSSEENLSATIKTKLDAAGADVGKVIAWDKSSGCFDLMSSIVEMEDMIAANKTRVIVFDPLSLALSCPSSDAQSRREMNMLAALAEKTDVAILGIRHLTKTRGRSNLTQGAGSVAISAVARSVLRVCADPQPDDLYRRKLVPIKASLVRPKACTFRTVPRGDSIGVEWIGDCDCDAIMPAGASEESRSALFEAEYFLFMLLRNGPVMANDVFKAAKRADVARRTLRRAQKALGVVTRPRGQGGRMNWVWRLPEDRCKLQHLHDRFMEELTDDLCHDDGGMSTVDDSDVPERGDDGAAV